jgi:hypothetical protein
VSSSSSHSSPNPLLPALWGLFDRLNVINGLVHHLAWQLRTFKATAQSKLSELKTAERDGDVPALWGGTSLPVSDLTQPAGAGVLYASGGFGTRNEEYLELADSLTRRNSAWSIAQGWEAHESFLFDLLATCLSSNPMLASADYLTKFSQRNGGRTPTSAADWGEFARMYRGRSNKDLLNLLRSLAPHFSVGEASNWRSLNLAGWYRAFAKVRHAITHSDLVLSPPDLAAVRSEGTGLLEFFPGVEVGGTYELRITLESAELILTLLAEHGFLAFKSLSLAAGYDWEVLGTSRGITWAKTTG